MICAKERLFNSEKWTKARDSTLIIDRQRLSVIGVSILPLIIGAGLAALIMDSDILREVLSQNTQPYTIVDILIQTFVSLSLGTLVVVSLFSLIRRRGPSAKRTIVAVIVSPILTVSFFIISQTLLLILFKGATNSIIPSVLSVLTLGVLLMSFIFIIMDSVPSRLRNFFVAFYGSIFGTFLGIIFFTASMIVLVISVTIEDYFLTKMSPMVDTALLIDTPGADPFDYTRIQTSTAAIGVGDYIAFSLISAHSLLFFPIHVWIMSMALAVLGVFINVTVIARENEILPGIPLPALLAIFPWVIHLLAFSLFVG